VHDLKKVIQNNFISLGYHLLIGIISFTLFVRLFINKPYTDLLLIMVPMLFYIIAGITFKPAKLIINDLFSFTLVGIIGALLWTYAFLKSPYDLDRHNVLYGAWWPYLFYLGGVTFIDSFMNRNNYIYGNMIAYVSLIYSIIPTILFFIGIEIRRIFNKIKRGLVKKV